MIKFAKDNLENINHVEIYPMISLLIFVAFFVGLFFWTFTRKKNYIDEVKNLPLEKEQNDNLNDKKN